ncbi:unnamed protein product [Protopolystoma xenopodis]|uniref:Uncharacterized protein n=1 Tax=Protopolystoma xenopodis TaxID=117903 RepID=A0A3S5BM53_9PLAT|nr:unnamed protein product [Protopolystoma xenopodis]
MKPEFVEDELEERPRASYKPSWLPPSATGDTDADDLAATKASSITGVDGVSGGDDEEDNIDLNEEEKERQRERKKASPPISLLTMEEKKMIIKKIIDHIPTAKDDLFAYPIEWEVVDRVKFFLKCLFMLIFLIQNINLFK